MPFPSARSWPSISRRPTFGFTTIRPDTPSACGPTPSRSSREVLDPYRLDLAVGVQVADREASGRGGRRRRQRLS